MHAYVIMHDLPHYIKALMHQCMLISIIKAYKRQSLTKKLDI